MNTAKNELISGVVYSAIAKYSNIIISIIVTMILSRLLKPELFGTVAIATIFISFFSTLTTVGISPAIVQNKTITHNELQSINSFTFLLALAFSLCYILCIPLITRFYENHNSLSNILYLLSINIFFSIASIVPNALFLKNKQFKFIGIRTLFIQLIMGIIAIVGAFKGLGIYSLLINPILGSICLFIINFYIYPIKFQPITKSSLDKILSFSTYQMLFNITYLAYRNIDKIFIGRIYNMSILGYYEKSYRLMMLPLENISGVISPVLHPILSEYQNDYNYIWNSYLKILTALAEIGFLLTVIIYFASDSLITIMYGSQWEQSIPIFKILSLSIGIQIIQSPIGAIFQSINKVKGLLFSSLWMLFFIICSIITSYYFNHIEYLTRGIVISFILGFIIYQIYLVRYLKTSLTAVFKAILHPLLIGIVLFILLYIVSEITTQPKNQFPYLVIISIISFLYIIIMILSKQLPYTRNTIYNLINRIKK